MEGALHDNCLLVAGTGALARVALVLLGAIRSLLRRREFKAVKVGTVEVVAWLEPPALGLTAFLLLNGRELGGDPSALALSAAIAGVTLVVAGLALMAWTLWSWRQMFVGHAVLNDHELVVGGAFGFVRHPVYMAAVLIWAGLAVAFLSVAAGVLTVGFVMPIYFVYARSEEAMMLDSFGDAYRRYRAVVPMFVPRVRRG
jgi:protein-S-isoprenylcysteine O-methyltransferase Ste14